MFKQTQNISRRDVVAGISATIMLPTAARAGLFGSGKSINIVIIENADVYREKDWPLLEMVKARVLKPLTEDRHLKSSNDKVIDIITSSDANESLFTGSPSELFNAGLDIMEATKVVSSCNDVAAAYKQARLRVDLVQPESISITHIGSMINIPFGCHEETDIVLPHPLPKNLILGSLASDPRTTAFHAYMVSGDQQKLLLDHLKVFGAFDRHVEGELDLKVKTPSTTIDELGLRPALQKAASTN